MSRIVALEGGVCSGKTSVCGLLEKSGIASQYPDYMDMVVDRTAEEIVLLPPLQRATIFLELDSRRVLQLGESPSQIVLDRCALTVFAFEYACVRTGYNSIEPGLADLANVHQLIQPDAITFLDVSDTIRKRREALRRNRVLPRLLEPAFNEAIREFFERAADFIPIQFLSSEASTAEEIASKVGDQLTRSFSELRPSLWSPLLAWAFNP